MSPVLSTFSGASVRGFGFGGSVGAAPAFESIATATGTGSSGTITFSSIPATYTSLQLRIFAISASGTGTVLRTQLNGDTGNNYTSHYIMGDGTSPSVFGVNTSGSNYIRIANNAVVVTNPYVAIIDFHDYASTTRYKTVRMFGGMDQNITGSGIVHNGSGMWLSNSAINSITITMGGVNFATSTVMALYGIKGA